MFCTTFYGSIRDNFKVFVPRDKFCCKGNNALFFFFGVKASAKLQKRYLM